MKKLLFVLAIVFVSASASFAQNVTGGVRFDVILGNRPPSPVEINLMRGEEAKHPNIAKSMHDIQDAMQHLKDAPSDFGGHKVQAENDLRQAWISLRKALYYNLYHDNQ
jgi:Skp family chaperone for outer membrane proteins